MISRVLLIVALYVGMVHARINSKNKNTEASRQIERTLTVEKYWDAGEDRELYKYMSASYGYGYQDSARNSALFWRRKSNS
jgi:hypothetical protein